MPNPAAQATRREANYQKLVAKIERTQRTWEKHDRKAVRLLKLLAKLERQRHRLQKAIAKERAEAANQLVEDAAQPATPAQPVDDGLPNFLRRADLEQEVEAANKRLQALPDPRTKEKRAERKAVEREKREAELTGKRRKLPLQGKAALKHIQAS